MSSQSWSADRTLAAFDEHLRRVRGLSAGTRSNYARFVGEFLEGVFPRGVVDFQRITTRDVTGFVERVAGRCAPRTVEGAATSLRIFFRFLRAEGCRQDRLGDAVPMVPHRRSELVRHLDLVQFERLLGSLDSSTPRALRDRAMILCVARLGLRPGEVARLALDDLDWANAVVRIRSRKTGHGALLPIPQDVGSAIAAYLHDGRPPTADRAVFVLHRDRIGQPISSDLVGRAVDHALTRSGIDAQTRGGNLLRHSLATGMLARGAGLREIGDLMGHRSLETTRIYAAVDVTRLREAAMPWPSTEAARP